MSQQKSPDSPDSPEMENILKYFRQIPMVAAGLKQTSIFLKHTNSVNIVNIGFSPSPTQSPTQSLNTTLIAFEKCNQNPLNPLNPSNPLTYDNFLSKDNLSKNILTVRSLNCGFMTITKPTKPNTNEKFFCKVQLSEAADSLADEAIITQVLDGLQTIRRTEQNKNGQNKNAQKLFAEYQDFFKIPHGSFTVNLGNRTNTASYQQLECYNALVTEYFPSLEPLGNFVSMYRKLYNEKKYQQAFNLKSDLLTEFQPMLKEYEFYGQTYGLIHSDLHFDNLQIDLIAGKPIILDLGRCFIDKSKVNNAAAKLPEDYSNNTVVLTNLPNHNFGYLCDVAMLSFNLFSTGILNPCSELFEFINVNNIPAIRIKRVYLGTTNKYIKDIIEQENMLYKGLMWCLLFLNYCANFRSMSMSNIPVNTTHKDFNKLSHLFSIIQNDMNNTDNNDKLIISCNADYIIINLNYMLDNHLMLCGNGMFMPYIYNTDFCKTTMGKWYKEYFTQTSRKAPGGGRKSKINKKGGNQEVKYTAIVNLDNIETWENQFLSKNSEGTLIIIIQPFAFDGDGQLIINENTEATTFLDYNNIITDLYIKYKETRCKPITQILLEKAIYNKKFTEPVNNFQNTITQLDILDFFANLKLTFSKDYYKDIYIQSILDKYDLNNHNNPNNPNLTIINNNTELSTLILGTLNSSKQSQSQFFSTQPAPVATRGGKSKKAYLIRTEKNTKLKYVRKSNKSWYLKDNRGKYRYTDLTKTKIFIK